tara:strand:+ start:144 stop:551 length:408 start_codon:yes stop_codon:yes gene_type:complete
MSKLSKENYEAMVSILADHNASDELVGALANYFEQDNPLFKRDVFLKTFFLKREVSQQLTKAHKHLNSMHSLAVKCFKCSKPLDVIKINYVMIDEREACYPCALKDAKEKFNNAKKILTSAHKDYRTVYFKGRGS